MLTPEQVQGLQVAFEQLEDPVTDYLVRDVARRVSEAGQLTSTAAYQIWRLQQLGKSLPEVEAEVARLLDKQIAEVERLFTQAAEVGYDFDVDRLNPDGVPFAANTSIQQITAAAVKLADEDFRNLIQTIGFIGSDGKARSLTDAYLQAADDAFRLILTGAADTNTAIRRACTKLAAEGIQSIDYASGVHTSLEAAIRRDMMGGLGLLVEQISEQNHDDLGADGWEISAHAASAPDHEPIQGRQYSDEAYRRLNGSLRRRIGTLNCGHNAFPILLGVNAPQYTASQLEAFRRENAKGADFEGRHFGTVYEATQYQRRIERAIRAQKRRILVDEGIGDVERTTADRIRLGRLREEYRRFSRATGLRTEDERLAVSGFGRGQAAREQADRKGFASFRKKMIGVESSVGVTIREVSPHVYGRLKERNVTEEGILQALTAPLDITKMRKDMSRQFIGESVTATVNVETGKLITVWTTGEDRREKLKRKLGLL